MPACRNFKALTVSLLLGFTAINAFAQSSGFSSPSAPSISSPSMPTITSPSIGSGFYVPGSSTNPVYTGQNSTTTNTTEETSEKTEDTKVSDELSLLSTLNASDISTLDSLGLLNQVTSLYSLGTTDSSLSLSNLYASQNTSQTNLLLKQVLLELEELKKQNNITSPQQPQAGTVTISVDTTEGGATTSNQSNAALSDSSATKAKILRFSVNGYNVLSTCRVIYISKIQSNGSFLITGDRRYMSDGKVRTETFHILFKPNDASNGISSYSTATAVTQDYLNQYSFLYELSQMENLNASRTGNLVSLRTNDPNWKLELLIDLGDN